MNRRVFFGKAASLGLGFVAMAKGGIAWTKDLPSDPEEAIGKSSAPDIIALPPFEKTGGLPLEKALLERKTVRSYDPARKLTREEISRILWAADGVNRADGRRTAPSAMAKYPVDILAALPEGVYVFEPKGHQMKKVISQDIRSVIPLRDSLKDAGIILLYVIDKDRVPKEKMEWADVEIGCIGQNVFLEAVSLGLASCIFAFVQMEPVTKALGLKGNQVLRIAQSVGAA